MSVVLKNAATFTIAAFLKRDVQDFLFSSIRYFAVANAVLPL